MAAIFAAVASSLAAFYGVVFWALWLAGGLGVAAIFRRQSTTLLAGTSVLTLGGLFAAACQTQSWWLAGMWLALIYVASTSTGECRATHFRWLWAPLLALALFLLIAQHVFELTLVLPVLAASLPSTYKARALRQSPLGYGILAAATIALGCVLLLGARTAQTGRVAYIDGGEWASAATPFTLDGLNIRASYSYSELVKLIAGEVIEMDSLTDDFREAWLVTPTTPIGEQETNDLVRWVRNGGRLIAVADHTDLYGHAKVLNDLLAQLGAFVEAGAFFQERRMDQATFAGGGSFGVLTPTAVGGTLAWPTASMLGYAEQTYYGRPNFFGPLTPTPDDIWARRALLAQAAVGKGVVVVVGDSTIFSNFAVYQPGNASLIGHIRSRFPLLPVLPAAYLLIGICVLVVPLGLRIAAPIAAIIAAMTAVSFSGRELDWSDSQVWSGDSELISLGVSPQESLTTAYSIAALSGRKPRWVNQPNPSDSGIWVSSNPPPSERWKHLSPKNPASESFSASEKAYDPLLQVLNTTPVLDWSSGIRPLLAEAGGIWTDAPMGDWWFDQGPSPARRTRFESLLAWLADGPMPKPPSATEPKDPAIKQWRIKIDGRSDTRVVAFAAPPTSDAPVLLGNGVSGKMVQSAEGHILAGFASWQEKWRAPKIWVATPLTAEKRLDADQ